MTLPTLDQVKVLGAHLATFAGGSITMFAALHIITASDANNAATALTQLSHGVAEVLASLGTLVGIVSATYATIMASPLGAFFRSAKAVAADPSKMDQLKIMTVEQQAPIVKITDKLPEVAGVGTTSTAAGKALADAVPSNSVQPVGTTS